MVYTQEQIIAFIEPILKKYHAESAILFGSYARREADQNSDIDVIVIGGKDFCTKDIFAVAEELSQASGKGVDVYEIQELDRNSEFYRTVICEGVKVA